ncbi:MAG: hypothetical protein HY960_09215 [Ignavibacteriae bacterium]|nr:hypothetical protein [Ignavibacteriota bacterium]
MKHTFLFFLLTIFLCLEFAVAHDAWLSAKLDSTKTKILVLPLVGEHFPKGDAIKDHTRFLQPSAYLFEMKTLPLVSDRSDSTILGIVPVVSSCIASASIKQREVTYDEKIAFEYITEEIGLSKEEATKFITPGVKEFSEAYSRHLKSIITTGDNEPKDTVVGLPIELVLLSWKKTKNQASVQVQLLENGKSVPHTAVRILSNGKTTIAKSDTSGTIQATIDGEAPALFGYIQLKKLSDNKLQSVWTNLSIIRLKNH